MPAATRGVRRALNEAEGMNQPRRGTARPGVARFSKGQIKQALRASGGFISYAARRLGCPERTVYNYLNRYPDLKEELQAIRESHVDMAESSLLAQIGEKNTSATIFYLECQGKKRGYVRNPALNLHAHVEAGSGTWSDIMKRVAKECGGEINAERVIDVQQGKVKAIAAKS